MDLSHLGLKLGGCNNEVAALQNYTEVPLYLIHTLNHKAGSIFSFDRGTPPMQGIQPSLRVTEIHFHEPPTLIISCITTYRPNASHHFNSKTVMVRDLGTLTSQHHPKKKFVAPPIMRMRMRMRSTVQN